MGRQGGRVTAKIRSHRDLGVYQSWLEFAVKCGYLDPEGARSLYRTYDNILGKPVTMIRQPQKWVIGGGETR
jgi:hypothetical protein